jgi:hypothetical protein
MPTSTVFVKKLVAGGVQQGDSVHHEARLVFISAAYVNKPGAVQHDPRLSLHEAGKLVDIVRIGGLVF